jgi:hypothetical protein
VKVILVLGAILALSLAAFAAENPIPGVIQASALELSGNMWMISVPFWDNYAYSETFATIAVE